MLAVSITLITLLSYMPNYLCDTWTYNEPTRQDSNITAAIFINKYVYMATCPIFVPMTYFSHEYISMKEDSKHVRRQHERRVYFFTRYNATNALFTAYKTYNIDTV